jgi:hypothetical protein
MTNEYQLADTITDTLESQTTQVIRNIEENNSANAYAILTEWVLNDDSVVLTHYLNQTTDSIKDQLMYITVSETHITEGSFWFDPEVELPIDNI